MSAEHSETSIKELIQKMVPKDFALLQGTVISAAPLKIQMDNDSKLIISSISTIIPKHLTDYTAKLTIGGTRQTVTVHNALAVGDKVHLLSAQGGKKYFILGRV